MCPFVPCEYPIPIEIGSNEAFGDFDLDNIFLPDFYCSQVQVKDHDDHHVKQSESLPSTSSADHGGGDGGGGVVAVTDRKMNHNASERDRRKKINGLYSSLRALLPSTDHVKKLSIPATVSRVLKYIPELQKEVKDLTHTKEELLLSESSFSQRNSVEFIKEKNGKIRNNIEEKLSSKYSVSVNKMSDKEMIIQISTLERISLSEVLMQVEKGGYLIVDVSSFQSFSGRTFHTIHLLMEGINVKNYGNLNGDQLQFLIQNQRQMYF